MPVRILRCDDDSRWTGERFIQLVRRHLSAPQLPVIGQMAKDMAIFAPQQLNAEYLKWKGGGLMRQPSEISISRTFGEILYSLVAELRPAVILEAGSGFGVSGSYMAAALQNIGRGQLVSFEISDYWPVAERNVVRHCSRARVINDRFENFGLHLRATVPIDFAFIDAIHDGEVIERQVRQILGFMSKSGVIVVDDVFVDGMLNRAIASLARDRRMSFAATIGRRQIAFVVR